jgi:hypothetical protein
LPLIHQTVVDGPSLIIWYKFKVANYLLKQKTISTDPLPRTVPQTLTPLRHNEVLVPIAGGEVRVQNMSVKQANPHHFVLREGSSYILIVFLESSGAVSE